MRFLLDASCDARLARHLRDLAHDVTRVGTDYPAALSDEEVLERAVAEGRVLITDDRDFGELVVRRGLPHVGIVYLRLGTINFSLRVARLDHVLTIHAHDLHRFLIITRHEVRIWGAPG